MAFNPSRRKHSKYSTNPYKRVSARLCLTVQEVFRKKYLTEKKFDEELKRVLEEEGITLEEWTKWLKSP